MKRRTQIPDSFDSSPSQSVKGVVLLSTDSFDERRQKLARIIVDSMYQFLGILDADGTVIEINRAALEGAGLELADVVGKPFWEARWWALSLETRERVRAMVAQARSGQFVRCDMEIYGEAKGFKTIVVDFSLTPILDDEGAVIFLLPEGRNISEKIAIEAELLRKNNEVRAALEKLQEIDGFKTKFFANVSHELRTPLTLILGPVNQLLQEKQQISERERFRLLSIKRNAHALLQQVNDLLDLARIDAVQMPLVYVRADVSALIYEVGASFAAAAQERNISLMFSVEREIYADIDRAKFIRILTNLLSNSLKFTPDGGRIRCALESLPNERFLLSVQDNGKGVPDKIKLQIFDRYMQADSDMSSKGTGLGLNIVKEFVELHRGTISVCDAPERGVIFQLEFPRWAPCGAFVRTVDSVGGVSAEFDIDLPRPLELSVRHKGTSDPRILVVEDNPDLRQFLFDVLIDEYQVILAGDGQCALDIIQVAPPDLVITDLMMPEMSGEVFVRRLRQLDIPNIPVLILSARADDALRETLLETLVQDYLTKPFSPQELRARVRNLVSVKRTVDVLQKELNSQASDITELSSALVASRKSLQEGLLALQISERRWLGFYENTGVGIALADAEGRIMKANPALQKMLGYTGEEILGVSLIDITLKPERVESRVNVCKLIAGDIDSYQIQKRYERKDGDVLWVRVSVSAIPPVDKEGPRVAVIVEDITARKTAEDALAITQAELARVARLTTMGELVASIAHEVNQPLSAIMMNTQAALRWIERETPDYAEVVAALGRVHRDAAHAGMIIARIRGFLKKRILKKEIFNIDAMIDDLTLMLHRALTSAGVNLDVRVAGALPEVMADPVQIQQVLLNLIVNAIDAMRDYKGRPRTINLNVFSQRGAIVFSVKDSGPGIPVSNVSMVFDAFFSTKEDGLGMGLAISRSIIESHNGKLWLVNSDSAGTEFAFSLPAGAW
jgi:PAS domain S-box-containing protein